MRMLWLVVGLTGCATVVPPPSLEHPRAACFLSCPGHQPMYANRQCRSGNLRGKDISITGEVNDAQSPRESYWLAGKNEERATYPKDDVVMGTCTMFFIGRGANDEHMMGILNTPRADQHK